LFSFQIHPGSHPMAILFARHIALDAIAIEREGEFKVGPWFCATLQVSFFPSSTPLLISFCCDSDTFRSMNASLDRATEPSGPRTSNVPDHFPVNPSPKAVAAIGSNSIATPRVTRKLLFDIRTSTTFLAFYSSRIVATGWAVAVCATPDAGSVAVSFTGETPRATYSAIGRTLAIGRSRLPWCRSGEWRAQATAGDAGSHLR
jgi:hypothetical protein